MYTLTNPPASSSVPVIPWTNTPDSCECCLFWLWTICFPWLHVLNASGDPICLWRMGCTPLPAPTLAFHRSQISIQFSEQFRQNMHIPRLLDIQVLCLVSLLPRLPKLADLGKEWNGHFQPPGRCSSRGIWLHSELRPSFASNPPQTNPVLSGGDAG